MTDDLLSIAQAAERLGVSTSRVRALIREGRLPRRKIGSLHVLTPADCDALERLPVGWKKGRPRKPDSSAK